MQRNCCSYILAATFKENWIYVAIAFKENWCNILAGPSGDIVNNVWFVKVNQWLFLSPYSYVVTSITVVLIVLTFFFYLLVHPLCKYSMTLFKIYSTYYQTYIPIILQAKLDLIFTIHVNEQTVINEVEYLCSLWFSDHVCLIFKFMCY